MATRSTGDPQTYSHLLDEALRLESLVYPSPSMLCFDNNKYRNNNGCDSLSASSSSNNSSSNNSSCITKPKRNRAGEENRELQGTVESRKTAKKAKTETPNKVIKVRKEKVGERITALQQLVSPFGKTDTASVLHEAMGYIRFLHDQVQVLSTPYLQKTPAATHYNEIGTGSRYDLRSRGLCLMPLECTAHVASSNGADFWSPATMGNNIPHH
ncbi:hypothetical protein ACHQM5_025212 [Ranunculus cassubicifolius]